MGGGHQVPEANLHYQGHSHEQLKQWTDTGQPGDAEGLGDTWKEMGQGLTEAAENLMVAVFGSEAGWTGQAAEAMRSHLKRVAEWSQKTGDSYKTASNAFRTQGEAVGSAKTSMPEVVQYDPGQMIKDAATSGNIFQMATLPYDIYQQRQAQQQAHEKAIQVVAQRDAELAAAAASIPPFEPPPKIGDDGGVKEPPQNPGMPAGGFRPGTPGGGSRGGVGGGTGSGTGGGLPGGLPGVSGPGFGQNDPNNPNGGDGQDGGTPPNVNLPSLPIGSGTGTSGFSQQPPPTNFGGLGPNGPAGGPVAAGGGGGFGGAFGGGFGPGGAPRPGGGFGPMGPGAAAGAGAGAGTGGPAGMAGRGGPVAGGRGPGGMGAGGMGAGRGQGGEDEEHQRPSYLVEPDPDATFGTDQMTAPPVIGG